MRDGFDHWDGDGDWTQDPWFLRTDDAVFREMGFALDRRLVATAGLKRLFPPDVCREMAAEARRPFDPPIGNEPRVATRLKYAPIIDLFVPNFPWLLLRLLAAGLYLETTGAWHDVKLLGRLRLREKFASALFELEVHANLAGAGYPVRRLPETNDPSPDFLVEVGLEKYEVEVKLSGEPDLDDVAEKLDRMLSHLVHVPGLHLHLIAADSLAMQALDPTQLPALHHEFEQIVRAFTTGVERIRDGGGKPGRYEVPPYGEIVAEPEAGLGSITRHMLPDLLPEKKAQRIWRLVRHAAGQFSREHPGVVIVDVHHSADMALIEDAVVRAARDDPKQFSACRMVVLVDHVAGVLGERRGEPLVYPILMPNRRELTKAQLRLAIAIGSRLGQKPTILRRARPGEGGLQLNVARPRTTSRVLGTAEMPPVPGTLSMKLSFDGPAQSTFTPATSDDGMGSPPGRRLTGAWAESGV